MYKFINVVVLAAFALTPVLALTSEETATPGRTGGAGNAASTSQLAALNLADTPANSDDSAPRQSDNSDTNSTPTADSASAGTSGSSGPNLRPSLRTRRTLDNFFNEIERLEAEQGAYSNSLAEQLTGLGEAYQRNGRHDDAIEVFTRAAHVNRINEGLYSLNQAPIIENLIESLIARGEWTEANERREYLYWLHQRNFGAHDPRMLPVMDSLSNWYLNVHAMNRHVGTAALLMDAHDLFRDSLEIISENYGERDLRKANALRGLTVSNWYLQTFDLTEVHDEFSVSINQNSPQMGSRDERLTTYIRNSYIRGKAAISDLVELYSDNPAAPPGAQGTAMVELGDWYMLFNKWRSAVDTYQDAHNMLQADSHEEARKQVDRLFSRPVALPDLPLMETSQEAKFHGAFDEEEQEVELQDYVLVSFDVTRFGAARNIEILESLPEDSVRNRTRVKNALKSARFRPRFVDGQPVLTEHVTHRYVFND